MAGSGPSKAVLGPSTMETTVLQDSSLGHGLMSIWSQQREGKKKGVGDIEIEQEG